MSKITLDKIRNTFAGRVPQAMGRYNFFAVLVPLIEKDGELYLLYEVRAAHMKRQPGEVCFPGGQVEQGESFEACAIRETEEELGISREDIKIISQMDTLYTYSNFTMFPFLGTIKESAVENLSCNADEVQETFLVPLTYFLEHEPIVYKTSVEQIIGEDFPYEKIKFKKGYQWRKGTSEIPIYEFEDKAIWGLTGRITRNLIAILKEESDV